MGIYKQIIANRLVYPVTIKGLARALIASVLVSQPHKRRGGGKSGAQEVIEDRFFQAYSFDALQRKQYESPVSPSLTSSLDSASQGVAASEALSSIFYDKDAPVPVVDISRLDGEFSSIEGKAGVTKDMSANSAKKHFADKFRRAADKAQSVKRGACVTEPRAVQAADVSTPMIATGAAAEAGHGLGTDSCTWTESLSVGAPSATEIALAAHAPDPTESSSTHDRRTPTHSIHAAAEQREANRCVQIASYSQAAMLVAEQAEDDAWSSPSSQEAALAEARAARRSARLSSAERQHGAAKIVPTATDRVDVEMVGLKPPPAISPASRVMRKTPSKVHKVAEIQQLGSSVRSREAGSGGGSMEGSINDSDEQSMASLKSESTTRSARSAEVVLDGISTSSKAERSAMTSTTAKCQSAATNPLSVDGGRVSLPLASPRISPIESATRSGNAFGDAPTQSLAGQHGDIEAGQLPQMQ